VRPFDDLAPLRFVRFRTGYGADVEPALFVLAVLTWFAAVAGAIAWERRNRAAVVRDRFDELGDATRPLRALPDDEAATSA
jgi:hypothetical protein